MQNRYCKRLDRLNPIGIPNQSNNQAQNAIQMPNDVLGAPSPSGAAASKKVGADNLLPPSYDLTIFSFSSTLSPQKSSDPCWIRSSNGQCSVCKEGYNIFNGKCNKLPPACLQFSADNQKCLQCDPQLVLQNGFCVDINCAVGIFSRCTVCRQSVYKTDSRGICINEGCI